MVCSSEETQAPCFNFGKMGQKGDAIEVWVGVMNSWGIVQFSSILEQWKTVIGFADSKISLI